MESVEISKGICFALEFLSICTDYVDTSKCPANKSVPDKSGKPGMLATEKAGTHVESNYPNELGSLSST